MGLDRPVQQKNMIQRKIIVNNKMQQGNIYELIELVEKFFE